LGLVVVVVQQPLIIKRSSIKQHDYYTNIFIFKITEMILWKLHPAVMSCVFFMTQVAFSQTYCVCIRLHIKKTFPKSDNMQKYTIYVWLTVPYKRKKTRLWSWVDWWVWPSHTPTVQHHTTLCTLMLPNTLAKKHQ